MEPCHLSLSKTRSRLKRVKYRSRGERITRFGGQRLLRLPGKQARGQLLGRRASRPAYVVSTYIVSTYIKESRVSGSSPFVAVVQSAHLGNGHHGSHFWWLNPSRFGRVLAQREMGSRSVIVIQVRIQGATKRALMKHDPMIEALPPNGTNHSLDVGSLPRGRGVDSTSRMPMSRTCSHRQRWHLGRAIGSAGAGRRERPPAVAVPSTRRSGGRSH